MQHYSRMTASKINAVLETSSLASRRHFRSLVELQWYSPPKLHELIDFNADRNASYTLVLPVFNQENIIYDFVKNNDQNACLAYNVIAIFDCCSDNSLTNFMAALRDLKSTLLVQVAAVVTDVPYFETACDNIGFLLSASKRSRTYSSRQRIMIENFWMSSETKKCHAFPGDVGTH